MGERRQQKQLNVDPGSMPLLMLLGRLCCASYAHLQALLCGGASDGSLAKAIETLSSDKLLQIVDLPHGRHGYALTPLAVRSVPALRSHFKASAATLSAKTAVQGWQRAALWSEYTRQGALILTGSAAAEALKAQRLLALDQVGQPVSPSAIETLRKQIDAQFAGHKQSDNGLNIARLDESSCVLLIADDPYRRMLAQLESLPVAISAYDRDAGVAVYLRPLPVVFVPSDEESSWHATRKTWASKGPRLRQWLRYTTDARPHASFPFHRVLTNVDPPPQAILRRIRQQTRTFSQASKLVSTLSKGNAR